MQDLPVPDLAMPDLSVPDLSVPDLAMPDLSTPDLAMPDLAIRDLAMPDLTVRDLAVARDLVAVDLQFDMAPGVYLKPAMVGGGGAVVGVSADQTWMASLDMPVNDRVGFYASPVTMTRLWDGMTVRLADNATDGSFGDSRDTAVLLWGHHVPFSYRFWKAGMTRSVPLAARLNRYYLTSDHSTMLVVDGSDIVVIHPRNCDDLGCTGKVLFTPVSSSTTFFEISDDNRFAAVQFGKGVSTYETWLVDLATDTAKFVATATTDPRYNYVPHPAFSPSGGLLATADGVGNVAVFSTGNLAKVAWSNGTFNPQIPPFSHYFADEKTLFVHAQPGGVLGLYRTTALDTQLIMDVSRPAYWSQPPSARRWIVVDNNANRGYAAIYDTFRQKVLDVAPYKRDYINFYEFGFSPDASVWVFQRAIMQGVYEDTGLQVPSGVQLLLFPQQLSPSATFSDDSARYLYVASPALPLYEGTLTSFTIQNQQRTPMVGGVWNVVTRGKNAYFTVINPDVRGIAPLAGTWAITL